MLRQQNFTSVELETLSNKINPDTESSLLYYPLTCMGERFPENDPTKMPILTPRPKDRQEFLHGISLKLSFSYYFSFSGNISLTHTHAYIYVLFVIFFFSLSRTHSVGILQAIALVERKGYDALVELGATKPTEIFTAGGGSKNNMWMRMRERLIGVKVRKASNIDAAFGAALLAIRLS